MWLKFLVKCCSMYHSSLTPGRMIASSAWLNVFSSSMNSCRCRCRAKTRNTGWSDLKWLGARELAAPEFILIFFCTVPPSEPWPFDGHGCHGLILAKIFDWKWHKWGHALVHPYCRYSKNYLNHQYQHAVINCVLIQEITWICVIHWSRFIIIQAMSSAKRQSKQCICLCWEKHQESESLSSNWMVCLAVQIHFFGRHPFKLSPFTW